VLRPTLAETLNRSGRRSKSVQERHTISQHSAAGEWGPGHLIDTSEMTPEEAVHALEERLRELRVNKPRGAVSPPGGVREPPTGGDRPLLTLLPQGRLERDSPHPGDGALFRPGDQRQKLG